MADEQPTKEVAKKGRVAQPKPMTVTERKTLITIIDNDFRLMMAELDVYASELKRQHQQRVEREFAELDARIREVEQQWSALREQVRNTIKEFFDNLRAEGISYTSSGRYSSSGGPIEFNAVTFKAIAKQSALTQIENDVNHQMMKIRTDLDRKRLTMHREALLAGLVTGQAKDLLDTMPDVKEILTEALQDNPRFAAVEQMATQRVQAAIEGGGEQRIHIAEVVTDE